MLPTSARIAAALALAAAALPAGTSAAGYPAHVPVPATVLQHTITLTQFPRSTNTPLPHVRLADGTFPQDTKRTESWIGATAGRTVVTDLDTHRLVSECAYTLTVVRCFEAGDPNKAGHNTAPNGVIWISRGSPSLLQSWADLGNAIKSLIGVQGGYAQIGTRTYAGRPAVILEQGTKRAPGGRRPESATVIAQATNSYPLYREDHSHFVHDGKRQDVDQVTATRLLEAIGPRSARLTLRPHPLAIVKDLRDR